MKKDTSRLLQFFGLTFAMAIPLTILGFLVKTPQDTPLQLPASAIMFILPGVVAAILVARTSGFKGVKKLWGRLVDRQVLGHFPWYVLAFTLMPALAIAVYATLRLYGVELAVPDLAVTSIFVLFISYVIAAAFEEIGWMGYAFDPMQTKWGVVKASLILGVIWALFHVVPWVQIHGVVWTIGWAATSILLRIPMTWLYLKTKRTLPTVILFHASINLTVSFFPGFSSTAYIPYLFAGGSLLLVLAIMTTGMIKNRPLM